MQTAIDRMGGLDVVINCGAPRTEAMLQDPDSPDALLAGFQFHVLSAAAIIQQALPQLIKNKGRIVNVSSAVSRIPQPDNACYTVSKAALDSLTRVWALKYAKHGIRVNSVLAGPFINLLIFQNVQDHFNTL
jgi:NAD(P)-dependent dehydrogenase (short-subunit alcohol dehydrogenase family)